MVVIPLDSPSCGVCLFDSRSGGCIGTLPDRPRVVPFEVRMSWCCLYGDGLRTWAGIIQVVLPQWFHLIREFVERSEIKICKIHTDLNISDPLTKPLLQPKHEAHTRAMSISCKIHTNLNISDPLTKPLIHPKHEAHTRAMGIRYILDWL